MEILDKVDASNAFILIQKKKGCSNQFKNKHTNKQTNKNTETIHIIATL
jgi:hypothetical protein